LNVTKSFGLLMKAGITFIIEENIDARSVLNDDRG
jgi:hypothetical protein